MRLQSIISPRSQCIACGHKLAWYDLIPVISWVALRGKCRYCKTPISILYPLIELLTATLLTLLYIFIPSHYFFAYFIFFSSLIVTIRSDLETLLISRLMTLGLIPLALIFSWLGRLPISVAESLFGALLGYFVLYAIAKLFYLLRGQEGIGDGDFDLLAFIGAFLGPLGCWITLCLASLVGSIIGGIYVMMQKQRMVKIPFGPFLAAGAIAYVFLQGYFMHLLLEIAPR